MSNPAPAPKQKPADVRTGQAPPAAFIAVTTQTIAVDVPWSASSGYIPRHLEGKITPRQGAALRHVHQGLMSTSTRRVHSPTDAARALLDIIADRLGLSPTGEAPKR